MNPKVRTGIVFVVCGIPGVFIFLISAVSVGMRLVDSRIRAPQWRWLLPGLLLGTLLTLAGIGKLNQPAYSLVFASIPISGWLYAQINPSVVGGSFGFVVFIGLGCWLTLYAVKRYYARQSRHDQRPS